MAMVAAAVVTAKVSNSQLSSLARRRMEQGKLFIDIMSFDRRWTMFLLAKGKCWLALRCFVVANRVSGEARAI
jgi:hypothetical protein